MSESPDRLPAATVHEVRSVIELYRDRFNDNDADGLAEIYAPNILFVNLGGVAFDGRQATHDQQTSGFRGRLDRITIGLEIKSMNALGHHYVLALVRQTINDRTAAAGETSAATMTIILDHTSGAWLIRHLQTTSLQLPWTTPGAAP